MDGFKVSGCLNMKDKKRDDFGISFLGKIAETIVVDRRVDKELTKLCLWASDLKNKVPDEEERAFDISKAVFERMGRNVKKCSAGKKGGEQDRLLTREKWTYAMDNCGEILLGDVKNVVCRHRALLFQVLAEEAQIDSVLNLYKELSSGLVAEGAHEDNWIFLRDGRIGIVDIMRIWGIKEKAKTAGKCYADFRYLEFKKEGGFPLVGSKRSPFVRYDDIKGRFSGGRMMSDGLNELLKENKSIR